MIDINSLDDDVREAIANNLLPDGKEDDMELLEKKLKGMSPVEAFDAFCNWHGLIGWSRTLILALDNIRESEVVE